MKVREAIRLIEDDGGISIKPVAAIGSTSIDSNSASLPFPENRATTLLPAQKKVFQSKQV